MHSINEIMTFLELKVQNQAKIIIKNMEILNNRDNDDKNKNTDLYIKITIENLVAQKQLKCIAQLLLNIYKNIAQAEKDKIQEEQFIDVFFEQMIEPIIENKICFNDRHAMYGYQPFHNRLKEYYIQKEQYEKCVRL